MKMVISNILKSLFWNVISSRSIIGYRFLAQKL